MKIKKPATTEKTIAKTEAPAKVVRPAIKRTNVVEEKPAEMETEEQIRKEVEEILGPETSYEGGEETDMTEEDVVIPETDETETEAETEISEPEEHEGMDEEEAPETYLKRVFDKIKGALDGDEILTFYRYVVAAIDVEKRPELRDEIGNYKAITKENKDMAELVEWMKVSNVNKLSGNAKKKAEAMLAANEAELEKGRLDADEALTAIVHQYVG
jgi:hypothetical protein